MTTRDGDNSDEQFEVRDQAEYERQRSLNSHEKFFQNQGMKSAEEHQRIHRQREAKARALEEMVLGMTKLTPGMGVKFRTVSDETFNALMAGGETLWAEQHFKPVSRYPKSLWKLRKMYNGEIGIVEKPGEEPVILVLEDSKDKRYQGVGLGVPEIPDGSAAVVDAETTNLYRAVYCNQAILVVGMSAQDAYEESKTRFGGGADFATGGDKLVVTKLAAEFMECVDGGHQLAFLVEGHHVICQTCGRSE